MQLGGISFRFIDTAGLRETKDVIEAIGVERTKEQMQKASLILYLFDLSTLTAREIQDDILSLDELGIPYFKIGNKLDLVDPAFIEKLAAQNFIFISASNKTNIEQLKEAILAKFKINEVKQGDVLVTNLRHYENLTQTYESLERVLYGMATDVTGDFLAMDIRQSLHYLGLITGEITTDDLLDNIFSKFCIGK
jgi:tRNA modification GTPase